MKITYITAKDDAHLAKIQDSAVKSVNKGRTSVQVALIATLIHLGKHGNINVVNHFIEALGNAVNSSAIVKWFTAYGKCAINEAGTGFDKFDAEHIRVNLDAAKGQMWWDMKTPPAFKAMNLDSLLVALLDKVEKQKAKAHEAGNDALVSVEVSDSTMRRVLAFANFEAIIADASNTDKLDAEAEAIAQAEALLAA